MKFLKGVSKQSKYILIFSTCILFLFVGCINYEKRAVDNSINPEAVFFDYNIWGDEESGNIIIRLQYRRGWQEGSAIVLAQSARVELDGEPLVLDSSKMNGAWYEISKSAKEFSGRHLNKLTDENSNEYVEEFDFSLLTLRSEVPRVISRNDLAFGLNGLKQEDTIQVLLTDTAYYSRGIDRIDTVQNGLVRISRADLDNVRNGPVVIEFYKDEEWALTQTRKAGGRIFISYGLKRVFELKD
jgi:hypothetical protein